VSIFFVVDVVGFLWIIMAFTFYSLLEATLLCLNAVCILHEERFLAKSMLAKQLS